MKYLFSGLLCIIISINANADTLTVIKQDYQAAVAAAKKEGKLILIDFYTKGCVPCIILNRDILDNKIYGSGIAQDYVLLKYDAGEDTVNRIELKHHVKSYPLMVVMDTNNRTLLRKSGAVLTNDMHAHVAPFFHDLNIGITNAKNNKYLRGISTDINLEFPQFYKDRFENGKTVPDEDIISYFENLSGDEYSKEVPFCIISAFSYRATKNVRDYVIEHHAELETLFGITDVEDLAQYFFTKDFKAAIEEKDEAKFLKTKQQATAYKDQKYADMLCNQYAYKLYIATNEWQKLMTHAADNKTYFINTGLMNDICWTIYEKSDDLHILKKAAMLMKEQAEVLPDWYVLDTYANLLYKTGDKKNAIEQMERAIKLGKAAKANVKDSEKALQEFKKAQ